MKKKEPKAILKIIPVVSVAGLIFLWCLASVYVPKLVPSPAAILERAMELFVDPISGHTLLGHIWASLKRVLIAMVFSTLIGVTLGVAIGWNKTVQRTIGTIFEIIRPIPPIAWLPLIIMWFGIGEFPKILMVFIGTLMATVINTYTGIRMVDAYLLDVGRSFQATQRQLLFEIAIPCALPSICTGLRNALGTGWMVVLAAEMIGADSGVGFLITRGTEFFDVPLIFVGMICIGIVGALLSLGIEIIERRICPWAYRKTE